MAHLGRPQMAMWRMRIARCVTKAANTHSEYVIHIAFPLQQRLHERASMLRHTHAGCLVKTKTHTHKQIHTHQ